MNSRRENIVLSGVSRSVRGLLLTNRSVPVQSLCVRSPNVRMLASRSAVSYNLANISKNRIGRRC